jgi:ribosomal protein L29
MKRLKMDELSKLSREDLVSRLNDLRSELSTLRSKAARGTLKKELGEIKTVRRNIARINTAITAERIVSNSQSTKQTKQPSENQESRS